MRRGGKRRVPRRAAMQLDFLQNRQPTAVVMPRAQGSEGLGRAMPRHLGSDDADEPGEQVRSRPRLGESGCEPHLKVALMAAVPLWIMEMRRLTAHQRVTTGQSLSRIVAEKSDILMFGGGRPGEVRDVFNALARGLAALSFQPGGVKYAGLHWETADAP